MRVLFVEDDLRLAKLIKHMLEKEELEVEYLERGDEVVDLALYRPYDLIILDWMVPGVSGIQNCDRLRKEGYQGPILMLTARDSIDDRVQGLDTGADDYLVKPFEFAELLARIRALVRRSVNPFKEQLVEKGTLLLNRTTRTVKRGMNEIQLTSREFQILDLLIQNCGRVVPREVIIDRIWGWDNEITSNNLDAYVRLLRKKIDLPGEKPLISNVRGVGYKLEE